MKRKLLVSQFCRTIVLWGVSCFGMGLVANFNPAYAEFDSAHRQSKGRHYNGGEVPTPFKDANTHVELSSGEYYILQGTVRILVGEPFFEINLERHQWLASQRRVSDPFYRLSGESSDWSAYDGQVVQLWVKAKGRIQQAKRTRRLSYEIILESLVKPERLSLTNYVSPITTEGGLT